MDATRKIQIAVAWADMIMAHAGAALPFVLIAVAVATAATVFVLKKH